MRLEHLKQIVNEYGDCDFIGTCCDCKESVKISAHRISEDEIEVTGGAIFQVPDHWGYDTPYISKCQKCFDIDKRFHPRTEVYSRVVGYLRPVKQWNEGKVAEFAIRKTFDLPKVDGFQLDTA